MKTRKITKTTISNDVIIEQLQNGCCTLARGIDIPQTAILRFNGTSRSSKMKKLNFKILAIRIVNKK